MSSTITVYEGPWMNWTKGPIRGGTITVSLRDAGILVAFFALFVTIGWKPFVEHLLLRCSPMEI